MKGTLNPNEWTAAGLLAEAKRTGQRIEDMPAEQVRDVMRRGFPDMRTVELPPSIIGESLKEALLRDLLVTRIGYASRAAGHFIPRPAGSRDHIFIHCVAGKGWLRIGARTWEATKNTALFIPAGVAHSYGADAQAPWSIYWIHFTGRQAAEYFALLGVNGDHPLLHLEPGDELLTAFRHIEEFMADVHTRENLVAASGALARYLGLLKVRQHAPQTAQRTEEQNVRCTMDFMRQNLGRPIALQELAHLAHMSISHYEAVFTRRTGFSPMRYLNQMRVQQACRLLTETDQPVRLIAPAVGLEDPYYFSRWFKKLMGVSPLEFRSRGHDPAF